MKLEEDAEKQESMIAQSFLPGFGPSIGSSNSFDEFNGL